MAKKPTGIEEIEGVKEQEKKKEKVEPIEFNIDLKDSFYMVEYPEDFEHFTIFNTLKGAVDIILEKKKYKTSDFRILSISKGSKGLEIAQIPWTDIIDIMRG